MRSARAHHRCAEDAKVGHFVGESPAINDIASQLPYTSESTRGTHWRANSPAEGEPLVLYEGHPFKFAHQMAARKAYAQQGSIITATTRSLIVRD
jgi:hypothetical protein